MKESIIVSVVGVVLVAPHLSPPFAFGWASAYAVWAVFLMWKGR